MSDMLIVGLNFEDFVVRMARFHGYVTFFNIADQ
jgi:hypothetical protein